MQKRKKSVFPGGVHPTDGFDKALSMDSAVQPYCPETVTILQNSPLEESAVFLSVPEII